MKYINLFKTHASYEEKLNGGGVDISLPNVSYCEDVKDIHYNPYNTVEFYVGDITGTTPQTVKIYTDKTTSVDVQVSEGNKWYTYLLPKDKGLCSINGNIRIWDDDIIKKVIVKANISYYHNTNLNAIISYTTKEAYFKGSDTSNVTDMSNMFYCCERLTSLDVSSFNTSKVTNMSGMFSACFVITSLDLSNFDTSKVTNMDYMFCDDSGLTSLDLSNFDTSKVTNMDFMFYNCSKLTSLDLSNFNTSNVTNMSNMFGVCIGLKSLDLSGWDTSKVTSMDSMFEDCNALKKIRMVGCSQATINKIKAVKPSGATIVTE